MKANSKRRGFVFSCFLLITLIACAAGSGENTIAPQNSHASTPLPTSTPSPRPSATSSATPWPTLEPTALFIEIVELLHTNDDCASPCIFGLVPGQSTRAEVEGLLKWLGADRHWDVYLRLGPEGDNQPPGQLDFEFEAGEGQSVQYIELTFRMSELDPSEYLSGFSPRAVLQNYGIPERIGFLVGQGPWDTLSYQLVLYYEDEHALFTYDSKTLFASIMDGFQICPLEPSELDGLWRLQLSSTRLEVPDHVMDVSEITDLQKQELIILLLSGDVEDCFYLYPMRRSGN